jgi:nitronate monooxygenase
MSWPDTRLLELFGVEHPILQAPMANATAVDMAVAVAETGALGSYPCAALTDDKIAEDVATIRARTNKPINLNFFCHQPPAGDAEREAAWLNKLAPYYAELGADTPKVPFKASIVPFTSATCSVVEQLRPAVVSFHFGLPDAALVARVKRAGCKIISSATTLREALYLAEHGTDGIIAQGSEAGGHRGMFLETDVATQIGTLALVQQIVEAVKLPVIAAGGIGDGRSIVAAVVLGAAGVQIGTAYLCCPEATTSAAHRAALAVPARETVITNVLSGKPARSILTRFVREQGPINTAVPTYPNATPAIAPLRAKAEARGSGDFSLLWSGQGAPPESGIGAAELTRKFADEALALLG